MSESIFIQFALFARNGISFLSILFHFHNTVKADTVNRGRNLFFIISFLKFLCLFLYWSFAYRTDAPSINLPFIQQKKEHFIL